MLTCKKITDAFNEKHPELKKYGAWLIQGDGYFYLASDELAFYRDMKATSIYTYRLKHMTLEQWISAIESLFEESNISPVYKLERFVQTAGGKCAIGSDNEYEWQAVVGVSFASYAEAKEHAIKAGIADDCRVTDGANYWSIN